MSLVIARPFGWILASGAGREAASWAAGSAFTFGIFFAMARLENAGGTVSRGPEIMDMPVVSLPIEAPPPRQRTDEQARTGEAPPSLTGIEVENTGSPVKIAVLPPDLEALVPDLRMPVPAVVSIGRFSADPKPQVGVEKVDIRHVYQASEVDMQPTAVERVAPALWPSAYEWGPVLSTTLLIGVGPDGRVENTRVVESSGHAEFDAVIAKTVRDQWLFTPAVRHGRKVRCLVQQKITLVIGKCSAFGVH